MAATRKAEPAEVAELDASPKELIGFYRDMLLIGASRNAPDKCTGWV